MSTERSHISKGGRGKLSLCGGAESTYITVVVDIGPFEVLVVWHEFQAQVSTNQLAQAPARPPNSGDEVRFVLHGSSLA